MWTPDTTIDLEDFIAQAKDEYLCEVSKNGKGRFIGATGASTYPHIHEWTNGTIALSVGKSTNTKIGKDGVIDIEALKAAADRFQIYSVSKTNKLTDVIRWVLSAAS